LPHGLRLIGRRFGSVLVGALNQHDENYKPLSVAKEAG
jgi:hypothetical protein